MSSMTLYKNLQLPDDLEDAWVKSIKCNSTLLNVNFLSISFSYHIIMIKTCSAKCQVCKMQVFFKPVTLNTRGYQSHFQCLQTACDSYHYSIFPSPCYQIKELFTYIPTYITSSADFDKFNLKLGHFIYNCK